LTYDPSSPYNSHDGWVILTAAFPAVYALRSNRWANPTCRQVRSLLELEKGKIEMGKGGRFGKYGEQKRVQRLRLKKKLTLKILKDLRERKATKS